MITLRLKDSKGVYSAETYILSVTIYKDVIPVAEEAEDEIQKDSYESITTSEELITSILDWNTKFEPTHSKR